MKRLSLKRILYVLGGFFVGLILGKILISGFGLRCSKSYFVHPKIRAAAVRKNAGRGAEVPRRSNIYLGMMSAPKFFFTRVQSSVDTWLRQGGWTVEIFADADASQLKIPPGLNLNVVSLPTVDDDAYPPQKKCFLMVRHMHDYHINNFDWFIRAEDDSYTDFPRLQRLLNKMNSSLPIFLGNPGLGTDENAGIEEGMKYLQGGLGMIFSRGLLLQLRPHLKYCIQHLYSSRDEIEMSRCIWKHTKAITPTAYELADLFYQQYDKDTDVPSNIAMDQLTPKLIAKTVTYHSVQTAELINKVHRQVLQRDMHAILNRTARLRNEIAHMQQMLELYQHSGRKDKDPDSTVPLILGAKEDVPWGNDGSPLPEEAHWYPANASFNRMSFRIPWIHWDRYYRHDPSDSLIPMRGHSKVEKEAIASLLSDIEGSLIQQSCPKFPLNVQFSYGYMQYGSLEGVRLVTVHRSSAGSTIKFCRTVSQISYGITLFREKDMLLTEHKILKQSMKSSVGLLGRAMGDILGVHEIEDDVHGGGRRQRSAKEEPELPLPGSFSSEQHRVIFVVPLQGRYRALEHFMENYEKFFLKPAQEASKSGGARIGNVQLAIVLLGNDEQGDDLGLNRASAHLLRSYQNTYGHEFLRFHVASTGDRSFSRGAGIQLGSLVGEENDIVFFMDVDMVVTPNLVSQCRRNVYRGKVAWYPIPFSQYDPDKLCFQDSHTQIFKEKHDIAYDEGERLLVKESEARERQAIRDTIKRTPLSLDHDRGFWRDFGFGIACMYKSDFTRTGGFDLTIEGWGEEDMRLFVSLIKSGIDVFRARQSDLIHIFHHKYCDSGSNNEQTKACRRTRASHFASKKCLADAFFKKNRQ